MIPYGHQQISQGDVEAVVEVLRSDWLTQGPAGPRFEKALATKVCAKYAVSTNSATSALHIACLALGLGPGNCLWTVPNTFVASANCGRYCGADVDFVDIDPETWNMSVNCLREKLAFAKQTGNLPGVVVPVHFAGQPTEQEAIWELAQEFNFKVLEDASHALGAARRGEMVGSCRWSHIAVFSFHPVKIITTGEGGMALTNDEELSWRMGVLRSHGITRDSARMSLSTVEPWVYEQQNLGFNYRMTDIQAALGASQLTHLDQWVQRRNQLAKRYNEALCDLPLQLPTVKTENRSAFHLYVIRLKLKHVNRTHLQVFKAMRAAGVGVNLHYMPVHLQPYYRDLGFSPGQFPEAEVYAQEAITLPLYPALSEAEQEQVVVALRYALED